MTEWRAKRFWSEALVAPAESGYAILLDDRPVRTPARAPLVVPTQALAEAIASEWAAQAEIIRPDSMPVTRAANAALDKVQPNTEQVIEMICEYGGTDLLCYRADHPEGLVKAQEAAWDDLVTWAAEEYGAKLDLTTGILPLAQPKATLDALHRAVAEQDAFALTALHDLVSLTGSLVIGLAAQAQYLPRPTLWERSRVDEAWQESQWGTDAEATEVSGLKRAAFLDAGRFHDLSR